MKTSYGCIVGTLCLFALTNFVSAKEVYHNPIDDKNYTAEWQTYRSEPTQPKSSTVEERAQIEGVILLSPEKEIEANIDAESLSEYITTMKRYVDIFSQEYSDHGLVLIQVELTTNNKPSIRMSSKGSLSDGFLRAVYDGISNAPSPPTTNNNIKFQVMFSVGARLKYPLVRKEQ